MTDYRNDATRETKAEMARNDRLNNTLYGRGLLDAEQMNIGRFAKPPYSKSPLPEYPKLPESSPWSHDPVGDEAPLGLDISAVPEVGEAFEIAASLANSASDETISPDAGAKGPVDPVAHHPAVDPGPAPLQPKLLRRALR
jgi:hypothetical protein